VEAKDEDGTWPDLSVPGTLPVTADVSVSNVAPELTVTVGNQTVDEFAVLFIADLGKFTDPGFDNPTNPAGPTRETFTYEIEWGDGTTDTGITSVDHLGRAGEPTTGSFDGRHVYWANGDYTVTVRVIDDDGGESATSVFDVHVNNLTDLSGRVYEDRNENGLDDAEPGIPGVLLHVVDTQGTSETDDDQVIRTAVTAANGFYQFTNLRPGAYHLIEAEQPLGAYDGMLAKIDPMFPDDQVTIGDNQFSFVVNVDDHDAPGFEFGEFYAVNLDRVVLGGGGDGFALLGLTNTELNVRNYAAVGGDVGFASGTSSKEARLGYFNKAVIDGTIYQDPGSGFKKFKNVSNDGIIVQDLDDTVADALLASEQALSREATQTFDKIGGKGKGSAAGDHLVISGNGGVNVVSIKDIDLLKHQSLVLSGSPFDVFIINVTGKFHFHDDAEILLADGLDASQVLWNVAGKSNDIHIHKDARMSGTILAPERTVKFEGHLTGALIAGGKQIDLNVNHHGHRQRHVDSDGLGTITYVPFAVAVDRDALQPDNVTGLSGFVFEDDDVNGVLDRGESGLVGIELTLVDENGVAVATATTDAQGRYEFTGRAEGIYTIRQAQPDTLPSGLRALDGSETIGSLGGLVLNNQDSNEIQDILFTSGNVGSAYNFAEIASAQLSGSVWELVVVEVGGRRDHHHRHHDDWQLTLQKQPIAGVEILLGGVDDRGNSVLLTSITSADGSYVFDNLRPGTYRVSEIQPDGFLVGEGEAQIGTAGGMINPDNRNRIRDIELGSREVAIHYDFTEIAEPKG
ncbi:MAG: hypothetical protein DRR42_14115, partial [Gammaproteobacteria bacterium]